MTAAATAKPGMYYNVYAWTIVNGIPELMGSKLLFSEEAATEQAKIYIKQYGFHVWIKTGDNVIFEY